MAVHVNRWTGVGITTGDLIERQTGDGTQVYHFSLLTRREWMQHGDKRHVDALHECVAFDAGNFRLGRFVARRYAPALLVFVEGRLDYYQASGWRYPQVRVVLSEFIVLSSDGAIEAAE